MSGQAGNINGTIDQRGNIFEGPRQRELPDAAAARHRVHRRDGGGRRQARLACRSPAPRRSIPSVNDDRPGCLYHGFCNRGGCHVDAKNSTAVTHDPPRPKTKRLRDRDAGDRDQRDRSTTRPDA